MELIHRDAKEQVTSKPHRKLYDIRKICNLFQRLGQRIQKILSRHFAGNKHVQ